MVSDRKGAVNNLGILGNYADILAYNNFYPGGMLQPGRNFNSNSYRFGFGGYEKDDEIKGVGNHLSFGDYGYDPRLIRRWRIDPLWKKYPDISNYSFAANNPIIIIDEEGEEIRIVGSAEFQTKTVAALQKLTNDKIELRNNIIFIIKSGVENPDKYLKEGTSLVRELQKRGVGALVFTIKTGERNQFLPTLEGGEISFVPGGALGGVDIKGERTKESGLGHELLHGRLRGRKGLIQYRKEQDEESQVYDPDLFFIKGKFAKLSKTELPTRKEENILRNEQGATPRAITIEDLPNVLPEVEVRPQEKEEE